MTFRVVGFDEFAADLEKASVNVRKAAVEVINQTAEIIRRNTKIQVAKDSWDLRDSVKVNPAEEKQKSIAATIYYDYPKSGRLIKNNTEKARAGSRVYYAYAQEFGTKTHRAHPALYPSLDQEEEKYVEDLGNELAALLKEETGGVLE